MHRLDLGIAGGVAEEHAAGEGVALDVGEPGVEGAGDALAGRVLADEVLAPDLAQLGEVPLQQAPVEVLLGGEVVIEDRRRHPRAAGDLIDRGALVPTLGKEPGRGVFDRLAPLGGAEALPRRLALRCLTT